jgi:hypothetical protein
MFFRPTYNAVFELDEPILPGTYTHLDQWFGPDAKISLERLMILYALNRYVSQGLFNEPGMYLLHMRRRRGWRVHGHLFKFPPGADLNRIAQFLSVIGINLELEGEHDVPAATFDPRLN